MCREYEKGRGKCLKLSLTQSYGMIPHHNLTSHILCDKMTQISDSANSGFRLLIRQANAAKRKFAESSSSSHSDSTEAILASQDLEPEPGEYTDGDWRIIMSDKLSRPFFFNTKTGVGSFAVPKEIAETTDAAELGAVSASQEGEVCISLCESANNGKRKRSTSIDIVSHDDHALSQTVNKSGSSGGSFEIPNAIKIDDTGTAAAVRNLIFVTEGETPVVAKSFDRSNHVVSDIKKSQGTPTIEILDDDDDDDDDNKDEDKDGDNNVKKIEKGTERLHAPDLIENGDQNTINVHNLDKHGIVESAYQSTDSTQLDITQSNEKISNGSSSKNNQIESNISWSCSQCTFENKSSAFTCCMCGMHSGRQRRSLRESQNTIMQGFALTQSQQTNYSTDVFPGSWR